jgi:hypothetical protein
VYLYEKHVGLEKTVTNRKVGGRKGADQSSGISGGEVRYISSGSGGLTLYHGEDRG